MIIQDLFYQLLTPNLNIIMTKTKAPAKTKKVLAEELIEEVAKPPIELEEENIENDILVGRSLGTLVIVKSEKIILNGKEVYRLYLSDATETILSDNDLKEYGVK